MTAANGSSTATPTVQELTETDSNILDEVVRVAQKWPKPPDALYRYGTVGFRGKEETLDPIMVRLGILAALRSKKLKQITGVMVTASHNPAGDNGAKVIDGNGEMLSASWEAPATALCNAPESNVGSLVSSIASQEGFDVNAESVVYIAHDNRISSPHFVGLITAGARAAGATVMNFGLLSTPQLHYIVQQTNLSGHQVTEEDYFKKVATAFKELIALRPPYSQSKWEPSLIVDCANGVGAPKMERVKSLLQDTMQFELRNTGDGSIVNYEAGADYVNINKRLPRGFDIARDSGRRMASIDGDADRVVFGRITKDGKFQLLDGDKIMCLYTMIINEELRKLGALEDVSVGAVQTAYANGSSTRFMSKTLGVPITWSPTGVRHLHHRAQEFDIGLYFESNGHGTVLFNNSVFPKLRAALNRNSTPEALHAYNVLMAMYELINQAVGDAITDLLLVEACLAHKNWSAADWNAIYTDMPSILLKVSVQDRHIITTNENENEATGPAGLQDRINSIISKYPSGRSFVRPSGTEDIVRIFAEAETRDDAVALGYEVSNATYDLAGGIGARPVPPTTAFDMSTMTLGDYVKKQGPPEFSGRPLDGTLATRQQTVAVLLAAGQGTRFKADIPKVIYPFRGRPLAQEALDATNKCTIDGSTGLQTIVVVGYASDAVKNTLGPKAHTYVLQPQRLGTGHAVYLAIQALDKEFKGDVLVLYADNPGVDANLIQQIIREHNENKARLGEKYSGMILTGMLADAGNYGRIVRGKDKNTVIDIVERKVIEQMGEGDVKEYPDGSKFSKDQLRGIQEFNSGIVIVKAHDYREALASIKPTRVKESPPAYEFYATDFVSRLLSMGRLVDGWVLPSDSLWKIEGANTLEELIALESRVL